MSNAYSFINGLLTGVSPTIGSPAGARKWTFINGFLTGVSDVIPALFRNSGSFTFINGLLVSANASGSSGSITPPPSDECTRLDAPPSGPFALSTSGSVITSGCIIVTSIDTPYPCKIRDGLADNPTSIFVTGTNLTTSGSDGGYYLTTGSNVLIVSAYDESGTDILYGAEQPSSGSAYGERQYLFSPSGATAVQGFRFKASYVTGSALNTFAKVSSVISGSLPLYSSDGIDIAPYETNPDQVFYLESFDGPIFIRRTYDGLIEYTYTTGTKAYYGGGTFYYRSFGYDQELGAYDETPYPYLLYVDHLDGLHGIAYFQRPLIGGATLYWDKIGMTWDIPSAFTYSSGTINFDFGYATGGLMARKFVIDYASVENVCNIDDP